MREIVIGALVVTVWASCLAPSPGEEKCKKACLHYAELSMEKKWSDRLATASDSERSELQRQKAAEWDKLAANPDNGLNQCVARCNRPLRQGVADCISKAETWAEAKECD